MFRSNKSFAPPDNTKTVPVDVANENVEADRDDSSAEEIVMGSVYLHVSNSGATFTVLDNSYGPTIRVSSSTFGNLNLQFDVHTHKAGLKALAKMFAEAAEEEYSDKYCHAAEYSNPDTRVCEEDSSNGMHIGGHDDVDESSEESAKSIFEHSNAKMRENILKNMSPEALRSFQSMSLEAFNKPKK